MKAKILFVDDDPAILKTYVAELQGSYEVHVAEGPEKGLEIISGEGPFAVVVSDLNMPTGGGVEFLGKVFEIAPLTVRIMITGRGDLESAIDSVNKGQIFKFLSKPCPLDIMKSALRDAVRFYSAELAERDLLRDTLRGSLQVLTDILSLLNPDAFGRSERIRVQALEIGRTLKLKNLLHLDLAAMLSQLGCVVIPDEVLEKAFRGLELSAEERQMYEVHPSVTASMISQIPRLERVSELIALQDTCYRDAMDAPLEARILKVCVDYDNLVQSGLEREEALKIMRERGDCYDPDVMEVLLHGRFGHKGYEHKELELRELGLGMILAEPLMSAKGVHLMPKGTRVTPVVLVRLENFARSRELPETLRVMVPIA